MKGKRKHGEENEKEIEKGNRNERKQGNPKISNLTHCRPAMSFGNRKFYFRGSFQFSIVTI